MVTTTDVEPVQPLLRYGYKISTSARSVGDQCNVFQIADIVISGVISNRYKCEPPNGVEFKVNKLPKQTGLLLRAVIVGGVGSDKEVFATLEGHPPGVVTIILV